VEGYSNTEEMNTEKYDYLDILNIMGEITIYFFVFFIFINNKMVMKIRYVLESLCIIKLLFNRKDIDIKGKSIYIAFGLILVTGIVFNSISGGILSVHKFSSNNLKFLDGIMLMFFIKRSRQLKILTAVITIASIILAVGVLGDFKFIRLDIIRYRAILTIAVSVILVYTLELFKIEVNRRIIQRLILGFMIATFLFIALGYSDSRMGFLSVIGTVFLYVLLNIFDVLHADFIKYRLLILLATIFLFMGVSYTLMPEDFKKEIRTSFQTKNNVSNEARLIMWQGSWEAFKASPVIGVGSAVKDTQPYIIKAAEKSKRNPQLLNLFIKKHMFGEAHSIYLNLLAHVGTLIFAYLFIFIILIPKAYFSGVRNEVASSCMFGMSCYLIYGVTWSVWSFHGSIQGFFQVLLAIMLIAGNK